MFICGLIEFRRPGASEVVTSRATREGSRWLKAWAKGLRTLVSICLLYALSLKVRSHVLNEP